MSTATEFFQRSTSDTNMANTDSASFLLWKIVGEEVFIAATLLFAKKYVIFKKQWIKL